jgi:glycosyltransferase involved in cell wall biosynthesis
MPKISVVIPVFNEEAILETAVRSLTQKLGRAGYDFELILSENGSVDQTAQLAESLVREIPRVRALHEATANYGLALKQGILAASGEWVICDEIDLGDLDFYCRAQAELSAGADMVIGSKRHPESMDRRPWLRRRGTAAINALLRLTLGFKGTDTHGLKAFKRERALDVVAACTVEHNLFASELVVRAGLMGLDVREIPLRLKEIRPPSVGLLRRVPHVLTDLGRLIYVIRVKGR